MNVPACAKYLALMQCLHGGCSTTPDSTANTTRADASTPSPSTPPDASTAPDKGPAYTLPLPAPGEGDFQFLGNDDTWRYVAPENPGRLYDASYFDGRFFVLHGLLETSEKAVTSERNFLSWSSDGLAWTTITIASEPFESYSRLASNGESLLLAGVRHVAMFKNDQVIEIEALEQDVAPPVILAYRDGYAIARMNDVLWLDNAGVVTRVLDQSLAQFRAGVARASGQRSVLAGPFGAFASSNGRDWRALDSAACTDCNLVGMTFGNDRYLAADSQSFFVSSAAERWEAHVFEPARRSAQASTDPLVEHGEDLISRVDFTAGHFFVLTQGSNLRVSRDGAAWSEQLKIPLGQIGPVACLGRCVVAAGRVVRPPIILTPPEPPADADRASPYYCEFMSPHDDCSSCYGATVAPCREGVTCRVSCQQASDCPAAGSGEPSIECAQTQAGGLCMLSCGSGETCPDGMTCSAGSCYYIYDDPRCIVTP